MVYLMCVGVFLCVAVNWVGVFVFLGALGDASGFVMVWR